MCGINGIWNRSGSVTDIVAVASRMNDRLRHRGPDDEGIWSEPAHRLVFGHRRLSILDLSTAAHQPMMSASGNVIVFNGEIYNYKELRDRFFPDKAFNSSSDTEVLLYLYERFGPSCVNYLEGMFAFAVWDATTESVFIARDRAGKKPLYYTEHNGSIAFSSELQALLELPGFKREADPVALYHFLTFNLLPPPLTMFRGIKKLPPSHTMIISKHGDPVLHAYWSPEYNDLSGFTEQQLTERTAAMLEQAVKARMVSDVPVGAFLSGGVDSGAVVSMMSDNVSRPVRTYSIGFEGQPAFDELVHARRVSKMFRTDHHERMVKRDEITGLLPEIVGYFDEPLADATCIPLFFLSEQAAADGTPVILTGDGSDELFAGYRNWMRYRTLYPVYEFYRRLPGFLKSPAAACYRRFGRSDVRTEMFERAAKDQEFFWGGAKSFKESTKRDVLTAGFNQETAGLDSHDVIRMYREEFERVFTLKRKDPLDWMCYLGYRFNIPNYYLHRLDRMGMAHSVELRAPFLDHSLTSFALSLDPSLKIRAGEPKYILKRALSKRLPDELLYRKKRGFNVPLKIWGLELLTGEIDSNLRGFCKDHPWFDETGLRQHLDRLKRGDGEVVNRLWTVYFLMKWFQRWMD